MWPFGNKEQKAADEAAVAAEFERLSSMPVADLAETILPAWGPSGVHRVAGGGVGAVQVVNWLLEPNRQRGKYLKPLLTPVKEAIQALENAGLLLRTGQSVGGSSVDITRLGETALASGAVRAHLPA
jgi:hypothetical protein